MLSYEKNIYLDINLLDGEIFYLGRQINYFQIFYSQLKKIHLYLIKLLPLATLYITCFEVLEFYVLNVVFSFDFLSSFALIYRSFLVIGVV
jgi:hypothetical protein